MNFFRLAFFVVLIAGFAACKDDDDSMTACTQSDWVGVYEGTAVCDGVSEDVTVTITASGADAIIIVYVTATVTTTYDPIKPNSCDLNSSGTDSGLTLTTTAKLKGDDLTLTETISGGGITSNCNLTVKRK